ncbi:triose-phosphate isomerase [Candidatus Woesearchaeota archaeon]|nr:triose-phosphate isomerase [Candidatus Woesearchaeota archaeon]
MRVPVVIVNFKTYKEATGEKAVSLAKICEKVAKDTGKEVVVAVQTADIYRVSQAVSIPVFAEHVDASEQGQSTGRVTIESVKAAGAAGTLVNHSERRIRVDQIEFIVRKAKELGITTVVCANDPVTGGALNKLEPNHIAVEPPELIGGDISVSSAKPEIIEKAVQNVCGEGKCERVIVGAGVKTKEYVQKAMELGSIGVLVASGVVKAKDPEKELRELVEGLG